MRIDGVSLADSETSSDVLEKVKDICTEPNLEIPDSDLDRAHQEGKMQKNYSLFKYFPSPDIAL